MQNSMKLYKDYADGLLKKGVSPEIICIADVIKLCTEDQDDCKYDFNLDNIVAGPNGELIKINKYRDTIEIYNSIMDNFFTVRVYSLESGLLFDDGVMGYETSPIDSIMLYGINEFNKLNLLIGNDFCEYNREVIKDRDNINTKILEFSNKLSRSKLTELKENIYKIKKKFCRRNDFINPGIDTVISNIDSAYKKHSEIKKFKSEELSDETKEIINRKLYLDGLKEESLSYSQITIFPIVEIIKEYKEYNAKKTDKLVKKYNIILNKVYEELNKFYNFRIDLKNHLVDSNDINEMSKKHKMLYLKRMKQLKDNNIGGPYEY